MPATLPNMETAQHRAAVDPKEGLTASDLPAAEAAGTEPASAGADAQDGLVNVAARRPA
jgi:hypothetical protein